MAIEYEQTINDRFPNLDYSEYKFIDNHQERIGIDNISFRLSEKRGQIQEGIDNLVLSCKGFVYFYDAKGLSIILNNRLDNILERLDPESTILIFPGKGAQDVKNLVRPEVFKYFASFDMNVERISERGLVAGRVNVLTGKTETRQMVTKKMSSFVVVDDVILNGTTTQTVRNFIDNKDEFDWYAATWLALSPLQSQYRRAPDQFASSLPGYRKVVTAIVYQGKTGIPTCNSVSTFINDDKKSKEVARSYVENFVADKETFDSAIVELRKLTNE